MKLLNLDGSEFGEAPEELAAQAPEVGRTMLAGDIAFVRLGHGLRFYCTRDREAWTFEVLAATGVRQSRQ